MSLFLHPMLAFGALFAAVPLLLHFLMRQKPRPFEFPAMQFLKKRQLVNRKRMRLRHLLLLALRMSMLIFIAFMLARPRMQNAPGVLSDQKAPVCAVLVFDNTIRMQYQHENQTRLEAAKKLAMDLINELPPESEVIVLDPTTAGGAERMFNVDLSFARRRIEQLQLSNMNQSLIGTIESGLKLLDENELTLKELYVFSDLAISSWPTTSQERLKARVAKSPDVATYVIDLSVEDPQNTFLNEVKLSQQILTENNPLKLSVLAQRTGTETDTTIELLLRDNLGNTQKRDQQQLKFKGNDSIPVEFVIDDLPKGTTQGIVRLTSVDSLPHDNERYFTVDVRPAWKVLILANSHTGALFLNEALAPEEYRQKNKAMFDCTTKLFTEINPEEEWNQYSVICLLDPPPLTSKLWDAFHQYVQQGGGMSIFLGRRARESIASFNDTNAQELLIGKLDIEIRRLKADLFLTPEYKNHEMLALFRELESVPWDLFPVFRYWQLAEIPDGVRTVISFSDGQPALLQRQVGAGTVMMMPTPISDPINQSAWNELPVDWPFLLLMDQMMQYLGGKLDGDLNYEAGNPAVVKFDESQIPQSFVVTSPNQDTQKTLSDQERQMLLVTDTSQTGNYQLQGKMTGDIVRTGFSVNTSTKLSRLDAIPQQALDAFFGESSYRVAKNALEVADRVKGGRIGSELFPWLALLLVILFAAEHLVSNRFYRE